MTGRPRTTCPSDEDLEVLGKELVEWATKKENPKERIHLKQWYCLKKGILRKQWDNMCEKPVFRVYYEIAQAAIAMRYLTGIVNSSIAQRFLRLYFPELKDDEDGLVRLKAEIGKKNEDMTQDDLARKLIEAIKDSEGLPGTEKA